MAKDVRKWVKCPKCSLEKITRSKTVFRCCNMNHAVLDHTLAVSCGLNRTSEKTEKRGESSGGIDINRGRIRRIDGKKEEKRARKIKRTREVKASF